MTVPDTNLDELPALLAATARGDEAAFARLYALSSPHLMGLLLRMLKRMDWAEEALQDCYLRIWRRSESYSPERGAPMAWLATIARYRALDLLRARRPEVSDTPDDPDAAPIEAVDESQRPEDHAIEQEGLRALERCLSRLSADERRSVLLAYHHGYTHSELASALKTPLGTIKSWVRRGLQQLRACLEPA